MSESKKGTYKGIVSKIQDTRWGKVFFLQGKNTEFKVFKKVSDNIESFNVGDMVEFEYNFKDDTVFVNKLTNMAKREPFELEEPPDFLDTIPASKPQPSPEPTPMPEPIPQEQYLQEQVEYTLPEDSSPNKDVLISRQVAIKAAAQIMEGKGGGKADSDFITEIALIMAERFEKFILRNE